METSEILRANRSPTWMDVIQAHLADGALPANEVEAKQVPKRAKRFILYDKILYKCSYSRPLLWCVSLEDGLKILEEIHEKVCSSQVGGKRLQSQLSEQDTTGPPYLRTLCYSWGNARNVSSFYLYKMSWVDNSLKLTPVWPNKLSLEPRTLFASKPYECLT